MSPMHPLRHCRALDDDDYVVRCTSLDGHAGAGSVGCVGVRHRGAPGGSANIALVTTVPEKEAVREADLVAKDGSVCGNRATDVVGCDDAVDNGRLCLPHRGNLPRGVAGQRQDQETGG